MLLFKNTDIWNSITEYLWGAGDRNSWLHSYYMMINYEENDVDELQLLSTLKKLKAKGGKAIMANISKNRKIKSENLGVCYTPEEIRYTAEYTVLLFKIFLVLFSNRRRLSA